MQQTLARISLSTIRKNYRAAAQAAGVPVFAVVKDDAYGHGAIAVAHALSDMAPMFAVSSVAEGAQLAYAGIARDILVLTPPLSREEVVRANALGLVLSVTSFPVLRLLQEAGGGARVHLAVNTGMNRYGFAPNEVAAACRMAEGTLFVEGAFSHLYDPADAGARAAQESAFARACATVKQFFPRAICHLSATGGVVFGARGWDGVRVGLALYGYAPVGLAVRPAMRVYATVAHSGRGYGGGVGYAKATRRYDVLHTLRAGYGDGFFREGGLGAEGKLCMDACVRAGNAPFGARVCILSDAAAYAAEHGTTAYEVLVSVGRRAEKEYV